MHAMQEQAKDAAMQEQAKERHGGRHDVLNTVTHAHGVQAVCT